MCVGVIDGFIRITDSEFASISSLVYEKTGIRLTEQKKTLVETRLGKLLRQLGFENFGQYYDYVLADTSGEAISLLIEKVSTNHSYFFRESDHFDYLVETVLPPLVEQKKAAGDRTLRIWCAGCAGGEESYTLAMLLQEFFGPEIVTWDIGILATDISIGALNKACEGVYAPEKLHVVPDACRKTYFKEQEDGRFRVIDKLKDMILFKHLNLMEFPYPFKNRFDVVFCRNVMIYFDAASRIEAVANIADVMHAGSYLFIGHSESLGRQSTMLQYIKPAVYCRLPGAVVRGVSNG